MWPLKPRTWWKRGRKLRKQLKGRSRKKIKSWKQEYLRKESPAPATTTREEMGTQPIKHYTNRSAREGFGPWF